MAPRVNIRSSPGPDKYFVQLNRPPVWGDYRGAENANELDMESGLYYYRARYYDPRTSVWLGVDPMSDKLKFWAKARLTFVFSINPALKHGVRWFEAN